MSDWHKLGCKAFSSGTAIDCNCKDLNFGTLEGSMPMRSDDPPPPAGLRQAATASQAGAADAEAASDDAKKWAQWPLVSVAEGGPGMRALHRRQNLARAHLALISERDELRVKYNNEVLSGAGQAWDREAAEAERDALRAALRIAYDALCNAGSDWAANIVGKALAVAPAKPAAETAECYAGCTDPHCPYTHPQGWVRPAQPADAKGCCEICGHAECTCLDEEDRDMLAGGPVAAGWEKP